MPEKLPIKLKKEPLIDAIFEIRFSSSTPASGVLPGFFFSKLEGSKTIERLPTAELPKLLLDGDPNLRYAPLVRIHWNNFAVLISDRSLAVGCKLPYPGWNNFRSTILEVVNLLREIGIVETVQRFSMKYIDLIPSSDLGEQVSFIKHSVMIGNHTLQKEAFSLRIEIPRDGLLHAVQIASSAFVTLPDGSTRAGVIVDTDTISNVENQQFAYWLDHLAEELDSMHTANKAMFFECLRQQTIDGLEPEYD